MSPPPWNGPPPAPAVDTPPAGPPAKPSGAPKIDYTRRPKPRPATVAEAVPPADSAAAADGPAPPVQALRVVREAQGVLRLTWNWPTGVTEAFVAVGVGATPEAAEPPSRKVTNTKYELDGGALLSGVSAGETLKVFTGRRDQAGRLSWAPASQSPATIAP